MAFPTVSVVTSTGFATSVTSMAVSLPASIASGDLLIATSEVRNSGTWTVPTDWIEFKAQVGGSSVGELTAFYKIANGTEGATATWTASVATSAVWQVRKVTSWHGTTPPEATSSSGDFSTNPNPPSLTPSWGAVDTLWLEVAGNTATANLTTGASTSYTGYELHTASSGGGQCSLSSASRALNATSEDPGEMTNAGSIRYWASFTIAVRPVASSGYTMTFPVGSYTYTGNSWTQKVSRLITLTAGSYAQTGLTFGMRANRLVTFAKGTYAYTGNSLAWLRNYLISITQGSYTYTGNSYLLKRLYTLSIASGSYVYTGFSYTLKRILRIAIGTGSYTYTGLSFSLKRILKLVMTMGSYTYTGFNLTLTKAVRFIFGIGSYSQTGYSPALRKNSKLTIATGNYSYTGLGFGLSRIRRMVFSAGSYAHTGLNLTFSRVYRILIASGTHIYTGLSWTQTFIENIRGVLLRGKIKLRAKTKLR